MGNPINIQESKIQAANAVMATLGDETCRFFVRRNRLRIATADGESQVFVASIGDRLDMSRTHFHCGSNRSMAIAQLAHWLRGRRRYSLHVWRYWVGPPVKLGNERTLELLEATDYGDPEMTACVACGDPEVDSLDWWTSPEGVTGPCHMGPNCIKEKRS